MPRFFDDPPLHPDEHAAIKRRVLEEFQEMDGEDVFDDAVHDVFGDLASDVNNDGFAAQIDLLLDAGYTEDDLRSMIKDRREEWGYDDEDEEDDEDDLLDPDVDTEDEL